MTWQEYQEAVALLYSQASELGSVHHNIKIKDKITGQLRQVDTWVEINYGDHVIKVLIDAKKYRENLDVRDIDSVVELAKAVGANKAIIVTSSGWSKPAEIKASFESCDLRILSIDEALELVVPDKWELCPKCEEDCILMDCSGFFEENGLVVWWIAGQCRECKTAKVHCQDCGRELYIDIEGNEVCNCPRVWGNTVEGIYFEPLDVDDEKNNGSSIINDPNQLRFDL